MIVDSSALIAIIRKEPDAEELFDVLTSTGSVNMSAATYVEVSYVVDRLEDPVKSRDFDLLLKEAGINLVPFDGDQARTAREALRDFGRGSGHPAKLNLGDCFSYALAKHLNEPLLFKGNDFTHTDVIPAYKAP